MSARFDRHICHTSGYNKSAAVYTHYFWVLLVLLEDE